MMKLICQMQCQILNVKQIRTHEHKEEKKENEIWSGDTSMDTVYLFVLLIYQ